MYMYMYMYVYIYIYVCVCVCVCSVLCSLSLSLPVSKACYHWQSHAVAESLNMLSLRRSPLLPSPSPEAALQRRVLACCRGLLQVVPGQTGRKSLGSPNTSDVKLHSHVHPMASNVAFELWILLACNTRKRASAFRLNQVRACLRLSQVQGPAGLAGLRLRIDSVLLSIPAGSYNQVLLQYLGRRWAE